MPISHRPYDTEADKIQMSALASQFRAEHLHVIDLPYRLSSWALDEPENVHLYQPPAGFTVRPLAGEKEVEAYVALHRSVFESKNMTADWRERTLQHPAYDPNLDLVVESPNGRLVAFCICWRQKRADGSLVGQVEPL